MSVLLISACGGGSDEQKPEVIPFGLQSSVAAKGDRVSDIAFAPDGRMFFAEQFTGDIRVVSASGQLLPDPFAHVEVQNYLDLDWGLTSVALDPAFAQNHYVYAFYTGPAEAASPLPHLDRQAQLPTPTPAGETPAPTRTPGQSGTPAGSGGQASGSTTPAARQALPRGQPILVRFTDRSNTGADETVISDTFPVTAANHAGYNANGKIRFGPDGALYASVGDYDYTAEESPVQDLSTPIGKLLRIDASTGAAASGNPFTDDPAADPRVFAFGFREPFGFAFHPKTAAIYGTDNTPDTCEELNIVRAGQNYSWPDVGAFPFADCNAGKGVPAIYHFSREGTDPGQFLSFVEVSELTFAPGTRYPALGDSLFVCESQRSAVGGKITSGVLRRLVLGGPGFDQVTGNDIIVHDCKGAVVTAPDGTVYYANATEIRKLEPGAATSGSAAGSSSRAAASGSPAASPSR